MNLFLALGDEFSCFGDKISYCLDFSFSVIVLLCAMHIGPNGPMSFRLFGLFTAGIHRTKLCTIDPEEPVRLVVKIIACNRRGHRLGI